MNDHAIAKDHQTQSAALSDLALFRSIVGRTDVAPSRVQEGDIAEAQWLDAMTTTDPIVLGESLGLNDREAERLALAMELHRRLLVRRTRVSLLAPEAVAELMMPRLIQDCESLWGIFLDAHSRLIGDVVELSRGDLDSCDAGTRIFFRNALKRGACKAIAVHNHPTGDPTPSPADITVTMRLVAAGRLLETPLVDHIVCTSQGAHTSIRRERPEIFRN